MTAALDAAEDAARLADLDPQRAIPVAAFASRMARNHRDPVAAAVAERAWGHALVQCGELDAAIRHLRTSIGRGQEAGSALLTARARIKLAYAMIMRGQPGNALREIDIVLLDGDSSERARAQAQRGIILREIGRLDEALVEFDLALPALRREPDLLSVAKVLLNRGILQAERHAFDAAVRDLRDAERLNRELGRPLAVGLVEQNLGFVEMLRGDVPAALAHLGTAEHIIGTHGGQLAAVLQDHGDLLLSVGLASEARDVAERAIIACHREQRRLKVPELRLLLAHVAFLERDWPRSLREADRAVRGFGQQQRTEWAALARLATLRARLAMGAPVHARSVEPIVATLTGSGWPAAAVEARLVAARVSISHGRVADGREQLRVASAARRRGPVALRARGWYAEALLRDERGDRRGAGHAARAGLRMLDEHGAALGATDLRVHSAAHRAELSELGLRIAMEVGRAAGVLEWAERGRASRLSHRAVLPAADPVLADLLSQLRATAGELDRLPGNHRGRSRLVQRQVVLERRIRDHSRLHSGRLGAAPTEPVPVGVLGEALGERALVEFVQLDGVMHALTLIDGRLRLRVLGPSADAAGLVDRLPFALHRLARRNTPTASRSAATALLADAAQRLDVALLRPLPELADRPLVLVPTGALHSVPWSTLPSCVGRPVTVSPSATLWHTATMGRSNPTGPVTVAAGPGLTCAREEAISVAAIHGATPLLDGAATAEAVLSALAESTVAHLAAHGTLATDNPLFSRLRLHDGPLVAYDLERLPKVPHTVVLASCDSGRSVVCTGDELLGLSATFIARGAAQLVASVVPIPDAETAPLMVALHHRLAAGVPAAVALADAQRELRDHGSSELAAAAGFLCIGT